MSILQEAPAEAAIAMIVAAALMATLLYVAMNEINDYLKPPKK